MTHGLTNTRLYKIFTNMKQRCYNSNDPKYKFYGGKGITICNDWLENFQSFYDWAMDNGYKENLTIDRINSDNGYSPDNCRWISMLENIKHRSNEDDCSMKLQIRQERESRNWAQEDVSRQIGLTRVAYAYIETGKRYPSYPIMVKLLDLFEYNDPRELFAVVDEDPIPQGNSTTK